MTLKLNGEVPFPEAGEGRFFCFTLADIAELEEAYGVGEYLATIDGNLQEGSGSTSLKCLQIGLKERKGDKRIRVNLDPDDISFPITAIHPKVMDALCLAVSNRTYEETIEEIAKRQEELQKLVESKEDDDGPLRDSGAPSDTKQSDSEQG